MSSRTMFNYCQMRQTHCELILNTGRSVILYNLSQSMTHEGWMEGFPTAEYNDTKLSHFAEKGKLVIPPVRRDYRKEPGDIDDFADYRFGKPEYLPNVTCWASFKCDQPARVEKGFVSNLTVVWFQNDFAFPIDPGVMEQLRSMNWEEHAEDSEY